MKRCLECDGQISESEFHFSIDKYGIPLCINDQRWLDEIETHTTHENLDLYFSLKMRGVPAEIEKFDGYKHIDIAIPEARINIEVDGGHHNYDHKQALSDLKRTYHSFLKGYLTLRIPNSLIHERLDETADYIVDFLNTNNNRIHNYRDYNYRRF